MKQADELKKFRWVLILPLPAFAVSVNAVMFGRSYIADLRVFIPTTLLLLGVSLVLVVGHIYIANTMRKRYMQEEKVFLRFLMAACFHFPLSALFVTLIFYGYDAAHLFGFRYSAGQYKWGLFAGAVCDIVGIAVNESIYRYNRWKETQLEAEQLSKEKLQTQLNSLLQQINPHFLFNSLNSLAALIQSDPARAQKFLADLGKVYRYLLRTNENELATLTSELQFIESYFNLLQTRFGSGVRLTQHIAEDPSQVLLPPLTLQLLIENAVKHNSVARSKPLYIEVFTCDGQLVVRNNLQKKKIKVESGKVGLANISEKYRLIDKSTIEIIEDDRYFTVKVPLIRLSSFAEVGAS